MRISDWSSDVCSSDLRDDDREDAQRGIVGEDRKNQLQGSHVPGEFVGGMPCSGLGTSGCEGCRQGVVVNGQGRYVCHALMALPSAKRRMRMVIALLPAWRGRDARRSSPRSEEHTSELQSLMRTSYAVFCLKKKKKLSSRHIA